MIATIARRRARVTALLGGAALLTSTAAGLAAADPSVKPAGPADADRAMVVCTAPGEPPLAEGAGGYFSHTITIERGDVTVVPARPAAPGTPPLVDGQCVRIDADGETTPMTPPVLELRR